MPYRGTSPSVPWDKLGMPEMNACPQAIWVHTRDSLAYLLDRVGVVGGAAAIELLEKLKHCIENRFCFEEWLLDRNPDIDSAGHRAEHSAILTEVNSLIALAHANPQEVTPFRRSRTQALAEALAVHLASRDHQLSEHPPADLWVDPRELRRKNLALWR